MRRGPRLLPTNNFLHILIVRHRHAATYKYLSDTMLTVVHVQTFFSKTFQNTIFPHCTHCRHMSQNRNYKPHNERPVDDKMFDPLSVILWKKELLRAINRCLVTYHICNAFLQPVPKQRNQRSCGYTLQYTPQAFRRFYSEER